ncbi:MAG: hypothetical protein KDE26_19815 [Bacteroidetes bacterium]|nr:hypothetical protein [Bacteroidota bacterium]
MKNYFVCFIIAISLYSCENDPGTRNKSYEEKLVDIKATEALQPEKFLQIEGTYRENLVGKTIIEGEVISAASQAVFKDIQIRVDFYSRTKSIISSENYVFYEVLNPNERKPFELRIKAPKAMNSLGLSVIGATPVY